MTTRWTVYSDKGFWNLTANLDDPSFINALPVTEFSSSAVTLVMDEDSIKAYGAFTANGTPTIYSDISGAVSQTDFLEMAFFALKKNYPLQGV